MNYTSTELAAIPILYSHNDPHQQQIPRKRPNKVHVSAACVNCKKAHLACDVSRPCQRCVATHKADTCHDIQHKKRGRPKMLRDSNNNKIRPISTTNTNMSNYRVISFPSESSNSSPSTDMMTILLSMDLCCARVTDESLEYLQLYPQEFSHRSIYDFLLPGESHQTMSKLHRCLLDNAAQHQQKKQPPNAIRSSFEAFHSAPLDALLNIANGSLTLKQKLKFRCGHGDPKTEEEMNCKLYLGGGLGADLFETNSLQQLYIVCVLSPTSAVSRRDSITSSSNHSVTHASSGSVSSVSSSSNMNIGTTAAPLTTEATEPVRLTAETASAAVAAATAVPLMASSTTPTPVSLSTTPVSVPLTNGPMLNLPPLILNDSSSTSPTTTNYSFTEGSEDDKEEDNQSHDYGGEYFCADDDIDEDLMRANLNKNSISDLLNNSVDGDTKEEQEKEESNKNSCSKPTINQDPAPPSPPPEQQSSLLDKFRYKVNRTKQFIHPNELYYKNITSSRLSSEAIAHTAHPYLSAKLTDRSFNTTGSSSLAAYNQSLLNNKQ